MNHLYLLVFEGVRKKDMKEEVLCYLLEEKENIRKSKIC